MGDACARRDGGDTFINNWPKGPPMSDRVHLNIGEERKEWARENHINLSSLVREAIDEKRDE